MPVGAGASPRKLARQAATELATYVATVQHWGHGRTPTNQQLRQLAQDMGATWEVTKLVEKLLPAEKEAKPPLFLGSVGEDGTIDVKKIPEAGEQDYLRLQARLDEALLRAAELERERREAV